jgi:ribosome-associated protein
LKHPFPGILKFSNFAGKIIHMNTFLLEGHEYIQLNQLLKMLGWADTGGEANQMIAEGHVMVNGQAETQKRKKLRDGDLIEFETKSITILAESE